MRELLGKGGGGQGRKCHAEVLYECLLVLQDEVLLESRRSSHSEASSSSSLQAAGGQEHAHRPRPADHNTGLMAMEATIEHAVEAGIDASMAALDAGLSSKAPKHVQCKSQRG